MKFESLNRITFSDQTSISHVRGVISKIGYYGKVGYDPIAILNEMGKSTWKTWQFTYYNR